MSGQVPGRWPNVMSWLLDYLPTVLDPNVFVREDKPSVTGDPALVKPYKHLLVSVFPGGLVTAVTRTYRVTLQGWAVKTNGLADLDAAFALVSEAGFQLESAPHVGTPLVFAEIDSGPNRVKDSVSTIEYQSLTLVLEVGAE